MDSVRINLHEEQSPQKKETQEQAIFPLIILFALIIARILFLSVAIIIQHFSQNSNTYIGPTDPQYIRGICSFTPYKSLCCSGLLSSISAATTNISVSIYQQKKLLCSPCNSVIPNSAIWLRLLTSLGRKRSQKYL